MSTEAGTDAAISQMLSTGPQDADTGEQQPTGTADVEPEGDDEDADPEGAEELGDAGKQALARMKEKVKAANARARAAEARAAEAGDKDETDRVRREAETAATAKANARILKAEIRAAAAGKLADPTDALAFLSTNDFEVDDDGDVDADEIAAAIDDLVRRKPHLAAQGGSARPKPDRSQGASAKGTASTDQLFANALKGAL